MKELPLSGGRAVALVDDEDFDRVNAVGRWQVHAPYVTSHGVPKAYAQRKVLDGAGGRRTVRLHRFILDAPAGVDVDHINGDGLDNRRCNLRICTRRENIANRRKARGTASRYLGVYWHKGGRKWAAQCGSSHIGMFENEIDAAVAHDRVASARYGVFAALNFPTPILTGSAI